MKKFGTTFVLLGIFVLLLTFVFFFGSDAADKKRAQSEIDEPVLSERQINDLDQIIFQSKDGEPVTLSKRENDVWVLNESHVDMDEQENLFELLRNLPRGRIVSRSQDNWGNYNLTDELASKIILMSRDAEVAKFYVGSMGTSTQNVYMRRNEMMSVYLVDTTLNGLLNYDENRWRNKHLFLLDEGDIRSVSVRIGEEKWNFEPDEKSNTYFENLFTVKADGIEADQGKFTSADNAISFSLNDGKEYTVLIDNIADGEALARITGQGDLFHLSSDLSSRIRPDFLKEPETTVLEETPSSVDEDN